MSVNERKDHTGRIKEVDLGLHDSEKQALAECRAAIQGDAALDDLRDATLARYLRHNSWHVEPAIKQMKEYLAWRKAENIDKILDKEDFPSLRIIRTVIPYAYHNADLEGRPIYIEKTGRIATAALADEKICDPDHLLHSHIYGVELLQKQLYENSLKKGERINGICTILDFDGLGFHHRQCLSVLKTLLDFDKKYYPEYLGKLFIINSPWVGPYLYQAVQVFLDEVTKARIQIISENPKEFLLTRIAPENLPKEYGGNCDGVGCKHGGLGVGFEGVKGCIDVLDQSNLKAEEVSGLDAQEVSYDFEREVAAAAEGDVFNWYFEVKDGYDIDFSVELLPVSGAREANPDRRVYIHKVGRHTAGKGTFKAPFANAKLLFRWDNNFSYFNSKHIRYTVQCMAPTSALDALIASGGSKQEVDKANKADAAKAAAAAAEKK